MHNAQDGKSDRTSVAHYSKNDHHVSQTDSTSVGLLYESSHSYKTRHQILFLSVELNTYL